MKVQKWFCPLYRADIAEGKCLDINYERLGYLDGGCLAEVTRLTGKREPDISKTCELCPNPPFDDLEGTVSFPRQGIPDRPDSDHAER